MGRLRQRRPVLGESAVEQPGYGAVDAHRKRLGHPQKALGRLVLDRRENGLRDHLGAVHRGPGRAVVGFDGGFVERRPRAARTKVLHPNAAVAKLPTQRLGKAAQAELVAL